VASSTRRPIEQLTAPSRSSVLGSYSLRGR